MYSTKWKIRKNLRLSMLMRLKLRLQRCINKATNSEKKIFFIRSTLFYLFFNSHAKTRFLRISQDTESQTVWPCQNHRLLQGWFPSERHRHSLHQLFQHVWTRFQLLHHLEHWNRRERHSSGNCRKSNTVRE